ncbi:MAG: hypothetical protein FJ102_16180 [Deltaproteobacteria bacterium]|nr:hypothetical protein [Deltaproteobacteria bacterium]
MTLLPHAPPHDDVRRAIRSLDDAELAAWTASPDDYSLLPAPVPGIEGWTFFELVPTGASRPVSVLLALSPGEVLVTSGSAEAVARVLAHSPAADAEALAAWVFELYRPRGRAMERVAGSAAAWRDAVGLRLSFDVNDAWNGVETWTAILEPGRARVDAWGTA